MPSKRLLIIECIPKQEEVDESIVLSNFIEMIRPGSARTEKFTNKSDLIQFLEGRSNLKGFGFIHISGHGDSDDNVFELPRGEMHPEEFPASCFRNKFMTFSACCLSHSGFMRPFLERTDARSAIAPLNKVQFADAAMWFVHFYYLVLQHDMGPWNAYDGTMNALPKVRGGFQLWE